MATLHTILRKAALRHLANRVLQLAGRGLTIGCAVSFAALMLDRLGLVGIRTTLLPIAPAAGFLVGALAAWFTRPRPLDLAVHLDRELSLKDRFGTAHLIEIRSLRNLSEESSGFAEFVQRDAQRMTDNLSLAQATPIAFTRVWLVNAALASALWLGAAYMPLMPLFDRDASSTVAHADLTAQQEQARKTAVVMRQAVQDVPRDPTADPQLAEELAAIDRLAQQMSESGTPEAAERSRQEAAARLADVADRLAEQSRRDLAASEQLAERFAGMNAPGRPEAPLAAHDLDETLKRGDFDQAARELDELLKSADKLSAEDRQHVAESLRIAAQEFQKDSPSVSETDADSLEQLARALADQGVDQKAIDKMLDSDSPPQRKDIERMLRERNVDEDIAGKLARELEELHDQQQARDQAQQDMKDVGESLDDAANHLEHPPAAHPEDHPKEQPPQQNQRDLSSPPSDEQRQQTGDPSQSSDSQAATQPDSAQQPPQQSESTTQPERAGEQRPEQTQSQPDTRQRESSQQNPQPGDERTASPQPDARSTPTPQTQPGVEAQPQQQGPKEQQQQPAQNGEQQQRQSQEQQSPQSQPDQTQQTPGAQPQPQSQPNPGDTTRQVQPQQTPKDQPQLQQDPQGREQTEVQRDQSDSQKQQQQQTQGEQQQLTQQQPQQSPDQNQPQASPDGTPGETPPAKPSDTLRKLAERLADAKDQQQTSERLRQTARDLARNMTPEQREQWAQQWQREVGQNPPPPAPPQGSESSPNSKDAQSNAQALRTNGDTTIGDADASREGNPNRDLANATTEDVDLRGKESSDQVLAQLLGEGGNVKGGTTTSGAATQRIHQAQKTAERAVNDSAVPSRYHGFIKRVFGRLEQTTRDASSASEPSPPNPPTVPTPNASGGGG